MKPGLGEYDRDGPESFTTIATRIRFLVIVNIREPKILRDLHDRTYHLFFQLILTRRKNKISCRKDRLNYEYKMAREFKDWKSVLAATNSSALCLELRKWSEDWNINADWCRDLAVTTLWFWRAQKREERGKNWGHEFPYNQLVLRSPQYIREIAEASRDLPSLAPPAGYSAYRPTVQLRKEYLLALYYFTKVKKRSVERLLPTRDMLSA